MKNVLKILAVIGIVFLSLLCYGLYRYGPNFGVWILPPSPQDYGKFAISRMENLGLYAQGEKWDREEAKAIRQIKSAKTYKDTYDTLEKLVKVAGGKHSDFISANQANEDVRENQLPQTKLVDSNILYLKVPTNTFGDSNNNRNYIKILDSALAKENFKAVIVDLADNHGGNMMPMLSGLSRLLPDDTLFTFEDRDGNKRTVDLPEKIEKIKVPVALIINDQTASSAEMTALAFQGLDNVKIFGKPSAGYTTCNTVVRLYDGALLQLTTGRVIARSGKVYENQAIQPDVGTDDALTQTQSWLTQTLK